MGAGSRTVQYTPADWDRMVRHGVKPDGRPAVMPSEDYFAMSDRELSDIVAYIRSLPPVDNTVAAPTFGPVGKMLLATGQFKLSADMHPSAHEGTHAVLPPAEAPNAEFGKHLAQVCTGCHLQSLAGGPIVGGPPDWPPAANLTPAGLVGWTYTDFERAMREGVRKDGTKLREPMALMPKYAKNMTDIEMQALWAYISTVPAVASAK
jgi:cytochrome c553